MDFLLDMSVKKRYTTIFKDCECKIQRGKGK